MKTTLIITFLLLTLAVAMPQTATGSLAPYEIVLTGENIVFDKAETMSRA